ncbi:SDR family oxidoreductase [Terriglobus albidus]|uniref:SDR family oxidoreductase n=1 Tax=Terriglobus albidus TaxID=1592106 RepID=A0A5B9EGV2_9BACT|nr:SDR family oxidoreductase [Terriglobus albidus]QEE29651.1 SDR family oxidoreductase [Terriglobus albidus]
MAKVLITGIAGFIGSSIARGVLKENGTVRGIDNLSTGKEENIEDIRSSIDFRFADVTDAHEMENAFREVDYVFHQAAIPSVPVSVADPLGTNAPNLTGTLCVLEAARRAGVKRFIYAASSAAYGDSLDLPKRESMAPAPISPYAVQKVAGEYYLASYARVYGLQTVALRYFNIFGPRQDPTSQYSGVLARFISQMLEGEAPTIFGDGTTSRDFTYIDNVVSANLLAAKAPSCVSGKIFNVGIGQATTLFSAYQQIRSLVNYDGDLRWKPEREGDIKHSVADISSARALLGYNVVTDFATGVRKTIDWYKVSMPLALAN